MIAATAPQKNMRHSSSHPHSMSSKSRRSVPSNALLSTDGRTSRASSRSIAGGSSLSTASSSGRSRKVFDTDKLQYVECAATISLFEQKLHEFNNAVAQAKKNCLSDGVHRTLNTWVLAGPNGLDGQSPLLTASNIEHLRYNYYERFEPNTRTVLDHVHGRTPPMYVHTIAADEQLEKLLAQDPQQAKRGLAIGVQAKVAAMEHQLTSPACMLPPSAGGSIRDALHLLLFWDDVYHDIRCESLEENYYGWLPHREITQRLMVALADFALQRLRVVTCVVSESESAELNQDERHELARNQFSYVQQVDTPLVACLAGFIKTHFLTLVATAKTCPDLSRVHELMAVVIACVCDNLKLHFYGHSRAESTTALFQDFLMCVFTTVMLDGALESSTPLTPKSTALSLATSPFESVPSISSVDVSSQPEVEQKKSRRRFLSKFRK